MSDLVEFQPWPKIARLNRGMVVTEKIDGSNAAVGILKDGSVYAQSRKRLITPDSDNFGFARWCADNAAALSATLGPGLHFGEWWGSGIQRGYGLQNGEKRFSLFNTPRYGDPEQFDLSPLKDIGVDTVPVLYDGLFAQFKIEECLLDLTIKGSMAAPGYMKPEGVIVFHVAAQVAFKVTVEGDAAPKGQAA